MKDHLQFAQIARLIQIAQIARLIVQLAFLIALLAQADCLAC